MHRNLMTFLPNIWDHTGIKYMNLRQQRRIRFCISKCLTADRSQCGDVIQDKHTLRQDNVGEQETRTAGGWLTFSGRARPRHCQVSFPT